MNSDYPNKFFFKKEIGLKYKTPPDNVLWHIARGKKKGKKGNGGVQYNANVGPALSVPTPPPLTENHSFARNLSVEIWLKKMDK